MASNVNNCTISTYIAVEKANDAVSTGTLPSSATMTITPDDGYILRARDFNISGGGPVSITTGGGNRDSVLFEKGTPGVVLPGSVKSVTFDDTVARARPDNLVTVTVNFEDDYVMPAGDTTVNININGDAISQSWREVYVKVVNTQLGNNFNAPTFIWNTPEVDSTIEHYNVTQTTNEVSGGVTEWILSGFISTDYYKVGTLIVVASGGYGISLDNHTSSTSLGWYTQQQTVNLGYTFPKSTDYNPNYTIYSYDLFLSAGPNDIPQDWGVSFNYNWGEAVSDSLYLPPPPFINTMSIVPVLPFANNTLVMSNSGYDLKLAVTGSAGAAFTYRLSGSGDANANAESREDTVVLPQFISGDTHFVPINFPANLSTTANNLYSLEVEPIHNTGFSGVTVFNQNFPFTAHDIFGNTIFNFTQTSNGAIKVLLSYTATGAISLTAPVEVVSLTSDPGSIEHKSHFFMWNVESSSGNLVINSESSGGFYIMDGTSWSNLDPATNGDTDINITGYIQTLGNNKAVIGATLQVMSWGVASVTPSININSLFD